MFVEKINEFFCLSRRDTAFYTDIGDNKRLKSTTLVQNNVDK